MNSALNSATPRCCSRLSALKLAEWDGVESQIAEPPGPKIDVRQASGHGGVVGAILKWWEVDRNAEICQRRAQAAVGGDTAADDGGFGAGFSRGAGELLDDHIDACGLEAGADVMQLLIVQRLCALRLDVLPFLRHAAH